MANHFLPVSDEVWKIIAAASPIPEPPLLPNAYASWLAYEAAAWREYCAACGGISNIMRGPDEV